MADLPTEVLRQRGEPDNINEAHATLRRRHYAENVEGTEWRLWPTYDSPPHWFVARHLHDHGYTGKPEACIDWPGGWFVLLSTELVVFVPVVFRDHGHVACFSLHLDIVEVSRG